MGFGGLLPVGSVLPRQTIAVIREGAEVVAGTGLGPLPVIALGPLPPDGAGDGLGEEVVLILCVVVPPLAEDGLLDDVLPPALLGKVQGLLGRAEGELHQHVGRHGVGAGHPPHEGVVPVLAELPVVLEADDPLLLGRRRVLRHPGLLLPDVHHALPAVEVGRVGVGVGRVEGGHLGGILREGRVGERHHGLEDRVRVDLGQTFRVQPDLPLLGLQRAPGLVVLFLGLQLRQGLGRHGARSHAGSGGGRLDAEASKRHRCGLGAGANQRGEHGTGTGIDVMSGVGRHLNREAGTGRVRMAGGGQMVRVTYEHYQRNEYDEWRTWQSCLLRSGIIQ